MPNSAAMSETWRSASPYGGRSSLGSTPAAFFTASWVFWISLLMVPASLLVKSGWL